MYSLGGHSNIECNSAVCTVWGGTVIQNVTVLCVQYGGGHRNTAQLRHSDGRHITAAVGSWGVSFVPYEGSQLCFIA